jgi:hypothetical protein
MGLLFFLCLSFLRKQVTRQGANPDAVDDTRLQFFAADTAAATVDPR